MTTIDLTVRLAPILFGMFATLLLSVTVIASEALRNRRGVSPNGARIGYAVTMMAVVGALALVAVAHETLALH